MPAAAAESSARGRGNAVGLSSISFEDVFVVKDGVNVSVQTGR